MKHRRHRGFFVLCRGACDGSQMNSEGRKEKSAPDYPVTYERIVFEGRVIEGTTKQEMMGLEKPEEMTGESLLIRKPEKADS